MLVLTSSSVPAIGGKLASPSIYPIMGASITIPLDSTPEIVANFAGLTGDDFVSGGAKRAPSFTYIVAAKPFQPVSGDAGRMQRSLDCLTAAVYYEARSEDETGQRAVAQVVLNRVRHYNYPSTICGVVFEGSSRRTGCQFSFTCDGSLRARREPIAWASSRRVAAEALAGFVEPSVGLATHYHTLAIRPYWSRSLTPVADVGTHRFYRWSGVAGTPAAFVRKASSLEAAPPVQLAAALPAPRLPIDTSFEDAGAGETCTSACGPEGTVLGPESFKLPAAE